MTNPTKSSRGLCGFAVIAISVLVPVSHVHAVDLPPGGAVALAGVPGGAGPGVVVHDELTAFEILGAGGALLYQGTLQNRVVRLNATGRLAFLYRIRDTRPGLNGAIADLATQSFSNFMTDVDFSTTSLGTVGPARARRTADGSEVLFDFTSRVFSGMESRFVHVVTEATAFAIGGATTLTLGTGDRVVLRTVMPIWQVEPGCRDIDFEDLMLQRAYPVGTMFASKGVSLRVQEFYFGPGGCVNPFTGGFARVDADGLACGSGNELQINNVNLALDYGVPLVALVINYGELGGNVNLEVNGACVNVQNFADLPPMIGGVAVSVVDDGPPGQSCGRLFLDGPITSVAIGGQELWIDDIFCSPDLCADDQTPPIAEITSPNPLTCVCDPERIIGTATDANFDQYTLEYRRAGGGAWTTIASSTSPVVGGTLGVWNSTGLSQGLYVLRLTVTDTCGLTETAVNIVWLGTVFDNLTVRSPENGTVVGRRVCFDGTVWDNYCFDSYTVEYQPVGGVSWSPVDPGTPVYTGTVINDPFATWETVIKGVPDGTYRVRVTANDDCGNSKTEMLDVIVDNTPPTAEITDPLACSYVEGVVEIRGTANDANLQSWVVQYTGGDASGWVTIDSGNTPVVNGPLARWDTTGLRRCAYTLRLVVTDRAILNCNGANRHRSEYDVSVNLGNCGDFDTDDDGDVDLYDFGKFEEAFTGPPRP